MTAVVAAGCGSSDAGSTTTTTPPPPASPPPSAAPPTTQPKVATAAVEPAVGATNTVFTLTGTNLPPKMTVKFDVIYPGGAKTFSGQQRQVPDDGNLQVTYRASASNPTGEYLVRIVGTEGKIAEAKFRVNPGRTTSPGQIGDGDGNGGGGSKGGGADSKPKSPTTTASRTGTTKKG